MDELKPPAETSYSTWVRRWLIIALAAHVISYVAPMNVPFDDRGFDAMGGELQWEPMWPFEHRNRVGNEESLQPARTLFIHFDVVQIVLIAIVLWLRLGGLSPLLLVLGTWVLRVGFEYGLPGLSRHLSSPLVQQFPVTWFEQMRWTIWGVGAGFAFALSSRVLAGRMRRVAYGVFAALVAVSAWDLVRWVEGIVASIPWWGTIETKILVLQLLLTPLFLIATIAGCVVGWKAARGITRASFPSRAILRWIFAMLFVVLIVVPVVNRIALEAQRGDRFTFVHVPIEYFVFAEVVPALQRFALLASLAMGVALLLRNVGVPRDRQLTDVFE